jgi:hypothetical protein
MVEARKARHKMQHPLKALHVLVGLGILTLSMGLIGSTAAEQKGSWHFERDPRDHPELEYRQGSKVIFYLGVGRAIGLWIAYPGPPQPDGETTITITTASKKYVMKGELTDNHDFKSGEERTTYFFQDDMGLSRRSPEFENLSRRFNEFIDSLVASKQIVISTEAGNVTLPKITITNLRKLFGV